MWVIYNYYQNMRNQWSWRTKSRLKAIDNTVKISQVIGKKDNFWQPFYPSFTNTTVVLVSEDKKTFETTKATADWLWNITFLKRWLADDWTDTEVSAFKRAWMPWTLMYVTFGSEDYENKADVSSVPTKTSDLLNDCWFVDSTALAWYAQNCDLCCVAFTNQYSDLDGQPSACDYDINDLADSYCCKDKRDCKQDALVEWANICITWCTISATVPTQACDIWALPDTTKYWASVDLSIDNSTYVITSQLKDQCWCNLGSACTIDLPLESVVVDWCYNSCTKEIELTLENSCKICFSVADLVSWLQSEITCSNKLSSDLVDDSWHTNLFVDCTEKCCISSALQPNDNVSCLCNDAWYLTTSTLPSLWSRVVKVEVATTNGTAAKVGTTTAGNYSPAAWDILLVHFKYWNSAAGVTLKVDNSAAKAIRIWWKVTTAATFTIPNQTDMYVFLMYDWQAYVAYPTDNTTYSASSFDIKNLADSCSCRSHWNSALQPNDNVSCLCNDAGYVTSSAIPDVSWFVDESCIACINGCCMTNWGNICIQGAGGDMEKCVYDPNSCNADAFDYCNMFNTPTIPTDNCQLANGCWYTTCTWTVTATDLAWYAKCCDVPTNNNQLINGCWFTTCTWTLTSSDIAWFVEECNIATINGCCLTEWGNICISWWGGGDMMASTYDPCNCNGDAFDYDNFHNTPNLSGYVTWPASSTDWNIAIFDWATGKIVKDSARHIEIFVITEDMITKTTTATKWVAPYNTSYYYTNFEIDATKWIKRVEWWVYYFVWNTLSVASSYRNVRVRIWSDGDWIPLTINDWTIQSGYSYVKKAYNKPYIYSTKYIATGALHWEYDVNSTYSAMTTAEIDAWTWTTGRTITPVNLKYAIDCCIADRAQCCDIPTDNCQLSNSCGYTTCTWTLQACDIANLAQCCDIPTVPTDNCQLANGCGYTTCTGTITATDLANYAKCCDIPTVPTDNCQLANWCGFTTCTWTLTSSDISWLVAESCIACINWCCLTNGGDICVWGGWGGTVMCECCYDPWDYQQDFLYFTYE